MLRHSLQEYMFKSILAGVCISLGCMMFASAPNPYLGSFLFSLGLVCVIQYKLPLYTGRIGALLLDTNPKKWLFYPMMILLNLLGCFWISGIAHASMFEQIRQIAQIKDQIPMLNLACNGILCGIFMELACNQHRYGVSSITKLFITILCVMGFILTGGEHSIADSFYWFVAGYFENYDKIALLLVMNGLGSLLTNLLLEFKSYAVQEPEKKTKTYQGEESR